MAERRPLDVERRRRMVSFIDEREGAAIAELSARFGVSEATVRRDLAQLSRMGLVVRGRGGAVPRRAGFTRGEPERPLLARQSLQIGEKRRIAEAAARHVRDGETIILSGGTTTACLVPHLASKRDLTVITNALNVASSLAEYSHITTIVVGGVLRHSWLSLVGSIAEDVLEGLRADKLFMGTPGLAPEYGLSADNVAEVQTDRAIMRAAAETIVLADHTKLGKVCTMRVAPIRAVSLVITDSAAPSQMVGALEEQGVRVEVV